MSIASPCPLLNSAVEPFAVELDKVIKDEFMAPVISNVPAKEYSKRNDALVLLPEQLISPVLYKQAILNPMIRLIVILSLVRQCIEGVK